MRFRSTCSAAALAILLAGCATPSGSFAGTEPSRTARSIGPERTISDPRSLVSRSSEAARPLAVAELFETSGTDSAAWASDGQAIYFTSDQGGPMAVSRLGLLEREPRRLTAGEMQQRNIDFLPGHNLIVFQSDAVGRQMHDLYALPASGGEPFALTETPAVNETEPVSSPNGSTIALAIRASDEASNNIAALDMTGGQVRRLTREAVDGLQWMPVAVSNDGALVLANRFDWSLDFGEVRVIDVGTGESRLISPENVYARAGDISPDGRLVSYSTEADNGMLRAFVANLQTGRVTALPPTRWDQRAGRFAPDGEWMVVSENVDGRDRLSLFHLESETLRALELPAGVNDNSLYVTELPSFSPDGTRLLVRHQSGARPADYWIYHLQTQTAERITSLGNMPAVDLPQTHLVTYPSTDGLIISAYIWMPYNLERDGSHPAVVLVHGGPTAQVRDTFNATATALASRGYVVIAPNFRGSTGYGREFLKANFQDLGGGDLEDLAAAAQFLVDTGYVDARRIGITGGSYGGYLTLAALTKKPDVFAAGVEMFGIVNWRTMWEHSPPQNRRYLSTLLGGSPEEFPEVYDRTSPLTYLSQTRAPLLVLQGENDPLVPAIEARQVVEGLSAMNKVVDSIFYKDEGHGFVALENRIDATTRTLDWFDRHLGATPARERLEGGQ